MANTMHHHGEILDAVCEICGGAARLTVDTDGTNSVEVGSNRLFEVGDAVEISDSETVAETNVVAGRVGLTTVTLEEPVSAGYLVCEGARIKVRGSRVPELEWVGRGSPYLPPQPASSGLPCVVVEPLRMEQPLTGGTNKSVTQDYWTSVHYLRRRHQGEDEEGELLKQVALLFDLLMADPYLGGTCWHSQVRLVDHSPDGEAELNRSDLPLRVVRLDVLGRRCEARG